MIRTSKKLLDSVAGLKSARKLYGDLAAATTTSAVRPPPSFFDEVGLEDSFGRKHDYLRISLTEKCNLRCKYCMPAEGVSLTPKDRLLSTEETLRVARLFARLGVRNMRLTGGEPTLRKDLELIVRELKAIPGIERVAMTTNALTLTKQLPALQRAGLDALNISLDSLREDRYETLARRPGSNLRRVLAGIDLAIQLGYKPVKVNIVLMKGINDDEIFDFVNMTKDKEVEVHRVHAVLGERVGRRGTGASEGASSGSVHQVRTGASEDSSIFDLADLERERAQRALGYGVFDDQAFLWRLQPNASHSRWTRQGVPVRRGGSGSAGCSALGSGGRRTHATYSRGAQGKEVPARRHEQFGAYEKSTNDLNRRINPFNFTLKRHYSTAPKTPTTNENQDKRDENVKFSHVDSAGRARMVDIGDKAITKRVATASCFLQTSPELLQLLREHKIKKGDAIAVSEVAGVLASKRTADFIPLCHTLPLDSVKVIIALPQDEGKIRIECTAQCTNKTGVEMEALTGAALAALTLYDMCKAVDKRMIISDLKVERKAGGRHDFELKNNQH